MEWKQSITKAICYMESNLTNEISVEDVSNQVFMSNAHFQRIFNFVTGITIGDYIRNRRLSLAGRDLLLTNNRVIDIAMRYQYDTSESFSKAFTRFHGIPPSLAKKHGDKVKCFDPITINIFIQGGFNMSHEVMENDKGIRLIREKFEYQQVGKLRFIGIDCKRAGIGCYQVKEANERLSEFLDPLMEKYATDITDYCMLETRHGQFIDDYYQLLIIGKFFKPDTPLPSKDWEQNFLYYYDIPTENIGHGIYSGDENFGGDTFDAYVFTRDKILNDGIVIPYPEAYWTAVQFIEKGEPRKGIYRFGYMFGVGAIK